jgi:hypothetical protein
VLQFHHHSLLVYLTAVSVAVTIALTDSPGHVVEATLAAHLVSLHSQSINQSIKIPFKIHHSRRHYEFVLFHFDVSFCLSKLFSFYLVNQSQTQSTIEYCCRLID